MKQMEISLKDNAKIIVREETSKDIDALMKFFHGLPYEDRKYLRVDVLNREIIVKKLSMIGTNQVVRIVALHENEIVAQGLLEFDSDTWRRNQAEIRVLVADNFRGRGLGMIMIRELYFVAMPKNVDLIITKIMRPQIATKHIFRKFGFREEHIIPDYVTDLEGEKQDLIIMICNVRELERELEYFFDKKDLQRE